MSKDKNHSEQFERYLKSQMTPREAHAFEREMLDDPFAQEALEGYEEQGADRLKDLAVLKKRVGQRGNQRFMWVRFASAAALILVGSLAIYFFVGQFENDQKLASGEEKLEEPSSPLPKTDAGQFPEKNVPDSNDEAFDAEEFDAEYVAEDNDDHPAVNESPPEKTNAEAAKTETFAIKPKENDLQLAQADAPANMDLLKEKDQMEIPNQAVIASEVAEEEAKRSSNVKAKKSAAFAGAASRSRMVDSSDVLEEDAPLEEVVILGDAMETEVPSTSTMDSSLKSIDALPIIGLVGYEKYLKNELQYPTSAIENKIEGIVILQVTISATGSITYIEVEQGLGYGCDQEAIRLIKEGPKWNPARNNGENVEDKVRIPVTFKI